MKKLFFSTLAILLPMVVWADVVINEANFPDANFRNYLLSQYYGADGVLSDAELQTGFMNVNSMSIASLKGIEFFTHLKRLDCLDNQLTELDLSANQELVSLTCSGNELTSLNLQNCQSLTWLECNNNQLASLDLSGCTSLNCIYCYSNKIKGSGMDEFMEKLPTITGGGLFLVDTTDSQEENEATITQVKIAKGKNWHVQYYFIDSETGERTYAMYRGVVYESTEGLAITETHFPDKNFRNYLLDQSYGDDGVITAQEIKGITNMDVSSKKVANLKGIENFTALTTLDCGGNKLTTLDLSHNVNLRELNCGGNELTALDLSQNVNLRELRCGGSNQFTTLDLSQNKALEIIQFDNSPIESIDLSKNLALKKIQCSHNSLKKLDLSHNKELECIWCRDGQLTKLLLPEGETLSRLYCELNDLAVLDVSKSKGLVMLSCSSNNLTELDVSNNTTLKYLYCQNNQLKNLDMSNNPLLTTLYCFGNKIKGGSMDALVESMPTVSESGVFYVIDAVDVNEGNECTTAQVSVVRAKNWTAYYCASKDAETDEWYWVEYGGGSVTGGIAINETNFPDNDFRNYILSRYDHNKDNLLSDAERLGVTEMYAEKEWVDGGYIRYSSIKGVELFQNLEELYCRENQLTSLDVSNMSALKELYCGNNQLTSLRLSGCTALERLQCHENQLSLLDVSECPNLQSLLCSDNLLSSLDVSRCSYLETLMCDNNQLTALNVSNCLKLLDLYCNNNQLTSLDVSACQDIWHIYCYSNNIKGAAMDAFIDGLCDWNKNWLYSGTLIVIDETDPNEQNICTTVHVASAKAKDWEVRSLQGVYGGSTPVGINAIETNRHWHCKNFDLNGHRINSSAPNVITIERLENGMTRKVIVK